MREFDVEVDGRTIHAYDTEDGDRTVLWLHGTPNIGTPPAPLFRPGVRWIGYDRPGYGGSTPRPDRDIASAVPDIAAVADALGLDRFAVFGHSGGGPHALACAALLPDRVTAAASVSGPAPFGAEGLDWFAGMAAPGSLRAAVAGRAAKERFEAAPPPEPDAFIPADHAALAAEWGWFMSVVRPALAAGPAPLIEDDLAGVAPWGFDPAAIAVPTLLVHGTDDAMIPAAHARWLATRIPAAELRLADAQGHVSVLATDGTATLDWLIDR